MKYIHIFLTLKNKEEKKIYYIGQVSLMQQPSKMWQIEVFDSTKTIHYTTRKIVNKNTTEWSSKQL